ncbi:MAG: cyclase family protein [Enterobacterales bacterium]|nr:cyclase family protein [Enterobacterales bacterium]
MNISAGIEPDNEVITKQQLEHHLDALTNEQLQGLVIRTLPNNPVKKSQRYNDGHYPPFLTADAMRYLIDKKVRHLLVDMPSVDKMYDQGMLQNHRIFGKLIYRNSIKSMQQN